VSGVQVNFLLLSVNFRILLFLPSRILPRSNFDLSDLIQQVPSLSLLFAAGIEEIFALILPAVVSLI